MDVLKLNGAFFCEADRPPKKMYTTIISDIHIPFQDDKAISIWFEHLAKNKVDKVIINGDLMDCFDLSSFDKIPKFGKSFNEELELTKLFLQRLREEFKGEIVYIEGNHSFRLRKYLIKIAPELYGLPVLDLQVLLDLDDLEIKWIPALETTRFTDTYIEEQGFLVGHFNMVRAKSGATATALLDKYNQSIIQAHVHRLAMVFKKLPKQELIGIEGGCMCNTNPPYMRHPNWNSGFVDLINGEPVIKVLK